MGTIKVLYVHSSDELYGSDTVLLELLRRLDSGRIEPLVVLPNDVPYEGLLSQELAKSGIPYRTMRVGVLRRKYFRPIGMVRYLGHVLSSTVRLTRIIKRERIDVVHSTTLGVMAGAISSAVTHTPHIWHVQEIITRPALLRKGTTRMLHWFADQVVAISQAVKNHLCDVEPALQTKVRVIHDCTDLERFNPLNGGARVRSEFGVQDSEILVGMTGRISHWKGQELFLDAAARVAKQCRQVRFVLVGGTFPGQEYRVEELQRTIASYGLQDRVTISGFRRDIPDVLAAFDVLISPSTLPEPFSLSVLEAMASGKPVIATAHGGPLEMVVEGVTGFLVQPGDPEAMAKATVSLVMDQEMREEMGVLGRKRAERHFSIERFAAQFQDLYEESVRGQRAVLGG